MADLLFVRQLHPLKTFKLGDKGFRNLASKGVFELKCSLLGKLFEFSH